MSHDAQQSNTHSEDTDNAYIEERLSFLEAEIRRQIAERSFLLREINKSNSPGGKLLPSHILSLIFQYTCPPINFSSRNFDCATLDDDFHYTPPQDISNPEANGPYVPIILGAISSHWRQIAWTTPEIWTTIVIEIRERTAHSHASLLQLYLRNVQSIPFSVELDFRREQKFHSKEIDGFPVPASTFPSALQSIAEVLFTPENAAKIKTLRLIAPPHEWLPTVSTMFPCLEALSLGWPLSLGREPSGGQRQLIISASNFPVLRSLRIHNLENFTFEGPRLPYLVEISLAHLAMYKCLAVLSLCMHLKKCHLYHPRHTARDNKVSEPITLSELELLDWSSGHYSTRGLQAFCAPALRHLRWDGRISGRDESWSSFVGIISRAAYMTSLHLTGETVDHSLPECWTTVFNSIPQLQRLTLEGPFSLPNILPIIRFLTPYSSDTPSLASMLPELRVIYFMLAEIRIKPLESLEFANELVTMVAFRQGVDREARLRIELDVALEWPEAGHALTEDVIVAMRDDGLVLDILEHGERIKWIERMEAELALRCQSSGLS